MRNRECFVFERARNKELAENPMSRLRVKCESRASFASYHYISLAAAKEKQ